MKKVWDAIVVGGGAMGSAALYQLAKKGKEVLGLERYYSPHGLGSSHGDTRITRLATCEGNAYAGLAMRSHEIWRELEKRDRKNFSPRTRSLLTLNGGLVIKNKDANKSVHGAFDIFEETKRVAEKYYIKHEILTALELKEWFPQFRFRGDEVGYYEPTAGFLRPSECIDVQLREAQMMGARFMNGIEVLDIIPASNGECVTVKTRYGDFFAKKVILTVGAWISRFLPERYKNLLEVHRQVLYWFMHNDSHDVATWSSGQYWYKKFLPENFPVFMWQHENGFMYGFPAIDGLYGGVKVATESSNVVDPDNLQRWVSHDEFDEMYNGHVKDRIPSLSRACAKTAVCMYTQTQDSNFIIDCHPEFPQIIIASPCSGHGFKHSAAIGEVLANMVIDVKTWYDLSKFRLSRFEKELS